MSAPVTAITGGAVVAFDGRAHRLIDPGVVVFEGDAIIHVGRRYAREPSATIDASGMLVIPGQISTHAHVSAQEGSRLLLDGGRRDFFRSGFLNYIPTKQKGGPSFLAAQDARASLRFGMAALVRHGITTVVPFAPGGPDDGRSMIETAAEFGLRVYYSPLASGGRYHFDDKGALHQVWDEPAALRALDVAGDFIRQNNGANDGRFRGIVTIDEFYFSTPTIRRYARDLAGRLGVGLTLHCSEQLSEFHETVRETGHTPVGLLASEGFLGPQTLLAHCLYIAGHSAVAYPYGDDLALLARSGASVAHSPLAFSRRGSALESFQRYLDAGVNMALGTDTYPLDMFSEMRTASAVCKLVEKNHESAGAMDVFNASNLGGARALGRDDLGRLVPGAKADIVLVDFRSLAIGPMPDPIRALVHLATPDMVDTVIVDGRVLMHDRRLRVCDESEVIESARESAQRIWSHFPQYDWAGRSIGQAFPPAIEPWEGAPDP
ncbi:MAG: amidohydrolase family protein [Hyphomicrobiaceae bacterium]